MKNPLLLVSLTTTLLLGCSSAGGKPATAADKADNERKSWYCQSRDSDSGDELGDELGREIRGEIRDEPAGASTAWDCAQLTKQEIKQRELKRQKQKSKKTVEQLAAATESTRARPSLKRSAQKTAKNEGVNDNAAENEFLAVNASTPAYISLAYRPQKPTALLDLPETFWAIQIMALRDQKALNDFVSSNQLIGVSGAKIESQGSLFYVLLLGVYESRSIAEQAWESRPEALRSLQPFYRSLGSLQTAIRNGASM